MKKTNDNLSEELEEAVRVLHNGGVILYPTDTVWGLGCDATDEKAVARIFGIKKRPDAKNLVTLASDMDMISQYVRDVPSMAETLVEVSDTPLTIIYPGAEGFASNVIADDGSAGIRIPRNDFCIRLLRRLKRPLVSTSANISGEKAPTRFNEISEEIKSAVDWCADSSFDAGATGRPSSIIKLGPNNEVTVIRK